MSYNKSINQISSFLLSRIFIIHLGVPCSWYTQNYFLQMSKMSEWANKQNEQMSKHFYSFKKMSKMSKIRVNEQNAHMSKFGVKWAPEVLIYYKNTPGYTMLMIHPGVPWVNSLLSLEKNWLISGQPSDMTNFNIILIELAILLWGNR